MLSLPPGDFSGYLFDCDGTLVDSMPLHYRAWTHALRVHGAPFVLEKADYYELGGVPTAEVVRILNRKHGTELDPEAVVGIKRDYYTRHLPEVSAIAPVVAFMKTVSRSARAVVSGGLRVMVLKTLEAAGLGGEFDWVIGCEDTPRGKPHPDPFLLGAERLGVDPRRCLVFEDSPTGEAAARAAGMACFRVDLAFPPER